MNIILVTAIWCPSCIIMRPRYQKLFEKFNLKCVELDFDDDEEEVEKLNVGKTLRVCIIIKDGKEKTRIIGEKSLKELEDLIEII